MAVRYPNAKGEPVVEKRIPALDGIRAIAVSMVIVDHFGIPAFGGLGVSIFFVLSGYLITTLLLREFDATHSISLAAFYVRRSLRIFPAYYVLLAFSALIDFHQGDERIRPVIVPAAFYYLNYYHALHGHSNASIAHAWSLAVEEQFYLLWPLGFLLIARWRSTLLPHVLVFAIVGVCVWRTLAYSVLGLGQAWAYDAFDCRFDALAMGCLLAVSMRNETFTRGVKRLSQHPWLAVTALMVMLLIEGLDNGKLRYTFGFTINALLIAFVMSQLLARPGALAVRFLDSRPLRFIGRISYGMYLYHIWGLTAGWHLTHSHGAAGVIAGYAATVGFALVSFYAVETPFQRLKERKWHHQYAWPRSPVPMQEQRP
jgi:peptidoglycan/LPS O-acetylase OafA/YrhL